MYRSSVKDSQIEPLAWLVIVCVRTSLRTSSETGYRQNLKNRNPRYLDLVKRFGLD